MVNKNNKMVAASREKYSNLLITNFKMKEIINSNVNYVRGFHFNKVEFNCGCIYTFQSVITS